MRLTLLHWRRVHRRTCAACRTTSLCACALFTFLSIRVHAADENSATQENGVAGSVEVGLAFAPTAQGVARGPSGSASISGEASASPWLMPALDWLLGHNLRLGVEGTVIWIDNAFGATGRETAFAPAPRVQMLWPIGTETRVSVTLSVGLAFMDSTSESALRGWSYRASVGAERRLWSYAVAFASIGTMSMHFWPGGDPFNSGEPRSTQLVRFESPYFGLGTRTVW